MDKNEREKQTLYAWGTQNKFHFSQIDKEKPSYFVKRENRENSYIKEYGFETLPQLSKELDALWGNDEMMDSVKNVVMVAAMKNKPSQTAVEKEDKRKEKNGGQETEDKLPVYIYNF